MPLLVFWPLAGASVPAPFRSALSFGLTVESRIGLKKSFGLTAGKPLTLK